MYGGTKGEMERLLADAQKLTGVKYDISNLDDVFMAVHAIQEEIGITGTTALEAEETIQGSFSAMKSAATNVFGALAIGENLEGSLEALAKTVSTFVFGNLIPMVGTIVSQLPMALSTLVKSAIPMVKEFIGTISTNLSTPIDFAGLTNQFSETFADIIFKIGNALPEFFEKGKEIVVGISNGVLDSIPNVIDTIGSMIDSVIRWIGEFLPEFMESGASFQVELIDGFVSKLPAMAESIKNMGSLIFNAIEEFLPVLLEKGEDFVVKLATGIWNSLPTIVSTMGDLISSLIGLITQYLPKFVKQGLEMVGRLAQGIWNNLPEIINTLGNLLMKLIGAIRERLPEFLQKGLELIGQLAIGLIKAIPGLVAKVPQIMGAIIKTLGSLIGGVVGIGGDIIKGLWKGIGNAGNWLKSKIKGLVGNVTSWLKKFFKIGSPSKLMADDIGQWLPKGLAEGIEDNTRPVTDAMADMADDAMDSFNVGSPLSNAINGLSINPMRSGLSYAMAGSSTNGGSSMIDKSGDIVIQVDSILDGNVIAQTVNRVNLREDRRYNP